jgi:uncharacterized membrane-anchored protein
MLFRQLLTAPQKSLNIYLIVYCQDIKNLKYIYKKINDMKKAMLSILVIVLISFNTFAKGVDSLQLQINEIEQSLTYKTGVIELESGNAKLKVPEGFRYLDKEQTFFVLTELWGNPADTNVLGMILPANRGVLSDSSWAFLITFEEMGFVKDDDANDINYDDLLKEMQKETVEANKERIKAGYEAITIVGWASKPYYDKELNVLHWAKELKFGEGAKNTLNYELRVLGRKGVLNLNAVASIDALPDVKNNINKIIKCVEYNEGNKYADFDPKIDNIAAWTIGGLVAGKVLAKAGFLGLLLKFWKILAVAVVAGFAAIKKFFMSKKEEEDTFNDTDDNVNNSTQA